MRQIPSVYGDLNDEKKQVLCRSGERVCSWQRHQQVNPEMGMRLVDLLNRSGERVPSGWSRERGSARWQGLDLTVFRAHNHIECSSEWDKAVGWFLILSRKMIWSNLHFRRISLFDVGRIDSREQEWSLELTYEVLKGSRGDMMVVWTRGLQWRWLEVVAFGIYFESWAYRTCVGWGKEEFWSEWIKTPSPDVGKTEGEEVHICSRVKNVTMYLLLANSQSHIRGFQMACSKEIGFIFG